MGNVPILSVGYVFGEKAEISKNHEVLFTPKLFHLSQFIVLHCTTFYAKFVTSVSA